MIGIKALRLYNVQFWNSMANRFNSVFGLFDERSGNPFNYKASCLALKFTENLWCKKFVLRFLRKEERRSHEA